MAMEAASVVNVAKDFSAFPAGRTRGPYSGARFRQKFLEEAVKAKRKTTIIFDGVVGLPSSFLEEAFGGLVRNKLVASLADFKSLFSIVATDPSISNANDLVESYISDALAA